MKPKIVFDKYPILMQRAEGGLRIINVDGTVDWDPCGDEPCQFEQYPEGMYACTTGNSQEEAYLKALTYDRKYELGCCVGGELSYSAFLGYL